MTVWQAFKADLRGGRDPELTKAAWEALIFGGGGIVCAIAMLIWLFNWVNRS